MARHVRKPAPYSVQPRRGTYPAELWDAQRSITLLTTQLHAERGALETWQRRLKLRTDWERSHAGASQLPVLRQETAACHARVIELERRLAEAYPQVRILRARQDLSNGSQRA